MNSILKLILAIILIFSIVSFTVSATDPVDKWCHTLSELKCWLSNECFYDPNEKVCKKMRLH